MSSGRTWREFSESAKIGYVLAFVDAFYYDGLVGKGADSNTTDSPFKLTTGFSASDYIEKVDKFYLNPA
jgi:hypothetical protein